jgi:ubiquinone/menaquinone biosynthesis C-methylase UbiE
VPDDSLRAAWDGQAENWIAWNRNNRDDTFYRFHGERFFELVPEPGALTLDIGAGEGRVGRALHERGHTVVELEGSPTMARASAELGGIAVAGDAACLPFPSSIADVAIAFMSLHDVDDMPGAVLEIARVLKSGGALVMAIVHPINSAGEWSESETFSLYQDSYFKERVYSDSIEHDGLPMTFNSRHRPLDAWSGALEAAGFTIEAIREVGDEEGKWTRVPLFLDLRARRS